MLNKNTWGVKGAYKYPIGRPVRATITLYPIGRPVRATITLYPIGRPVRATHHCIALSLLSLSE